MPSQIPTIFKVSGVSFCKEVIKKLEKNQILKMELDPENKFDKLAIKILTLDDEMCGFVPKKFKVGEDDIELNKLVHQKFDKLSRKYNLKVYEIYEWNGPSGLEVIFEKKSLS